MIVQLILKKTWQRVSGRCLPRVLQSFHPQKKKRKKSHKRKFFLFPVCCVSLGFGRFKGTKTTQLHVDHFFWTLKATNKRGHLLFCFFLFFSCFVLASNNKKMMLQAVAHLPLQQVLFCFSFVSERKTSENEGRIIRLILNNIFVFYFLLLLLLLIFVFFLL